MITSIRICTISMVFLISNLRIASTILDLDEDDSLDSVGDSDIAGDGNQNLYHDRLSWVC